MLAHELAHVENRDILVASIAAMIGAAISAVAHFLQFSWLFGGDDDESPLGIVGTLAAIILAPLAAMVLQLAVSRQREYLADETAAGWLGEGRPLASALASLERGVRAAPMEVNPATASLYIASPLSGRGMSSLFSTHPPSRCGSSGCARGMPAAASTGCCGRGVHSGAGVPAAATGTAMAASNTRPWPSRRRLCTRSSARSTWRSPGRSRSCPSASGRSTSTGCTRTWASSCHSSSRCCSIGTCLRADVSSIRSPGRARRSCRPLEQGYDATGVDVASFNCLLMRVKTRPYNLDALRRDLLWAHEQAEAFEPTGREPAEALRVTFASGTRRRLRRSCSTTARSWSRSGRRRCST